MTNILPISLAIALVFLNAFFVAAEFGMVKLRHTRVLTIKKLYGLRGKILAEVHQHLDSYLSACQLGITLASLGLGWVGEPAFGHFFKPMLAYFGVTGARALQAGSLSLAFILITFLHIVLGELMPKSMAIRDSERVSLVTALPLYGFYWLTYPAIWFMNSCTNALLKLMRYSPFHAEDHFYSTDEIKLILSGSYLRGELTKEETKILKHTLALGDLDVTDIMRPVEEMIVIHLEESMEVIFKKIQQYRYSRYPVYAKKQVVGILHVKDIFSELYQHQEIADIKKLIRPVLKVSRRLPALDLLRKFREGMPHFALIYSGHRDNIIGFVTLDNLLHILIGRVKDEFHRTRDDWTREEDGSVLLKGNASIYALERALNIDLDAEDISDEIDTITGLILAKIGRLPKVNEEITFKQFKLKIEKIRGSKILQVRAGVI